MSFWGRQHISKKNTWFEYGKQVFVVNDYGDGRGLFIGKRICQDSELENHNIGERYDSKEIRTFDEFYNIGLDQGVGQFLTRLSNPI